MRDPLAQLAAAAGYGDVERWWDDLVEHGTSDVFEAVEEAMAAVRETSPPPGSRELQREAAMRRALAAVVADGFGRVAVVCGAWHVPALRAPPSAADAAALRGLAKAKVAMTWVPWSSRRLAAASGYGAGVRAPVGTTTCSATADHRSSPAGSARWRACCGPGATRRRRRR